MTAALDHTAATVAEAVAVADREARWLALAAAYAWWPHPEIVDVAAVARRQAHDAGIALREAREAMAASRRLSREAEATARRRLADAADSAAVVHAAVGLWCEGVAAQTRPG